MEFLKNTFYTLLVSILTLSIFIIIYCKRKFTFFEKRNVYTPPPTIPFGNLGAVFLRRKALPQVFIDIYNDIKSKGLKYGGMYFGPGAVFLPLDLDVIKRILVKDFDHFINHGGYINEEVDPLTGNLFTLENEKWRNLRVKLTPTFTSGKMRMMFETLIKCTDGLRTIMEETLNRNVPIDIKDVLSRFSTDVIGSCAFGIECNTLKNEESPFRKFGLRAVQPDFIQNIRNMMNALPRSFLKAIRFRLHSSDVIDFFTKTVKDTIEYREKNNVHRKDFMHLLLQLKNRGEIPDDEKLTSDHKPGMYLTLPEITAQCFVFFLGGFETSSTLNSFALYELARNQIIQTQLRNEINKVLKKHDGKLTYDAVKDMTYMDQILQETLRLYPPLPILLRQCTKRYEVPGESVVIEEGNQVMVPIIGIQRDPEYYPNPEVFDPERFSEEAKATRHPFAWLPFGEGPRNCIGMRFGLMQAKVGLATVLKNYRILLNKKTRVPIQFDKDGFMLAAEGKIWIDVEKIE